MSEQSVFFYCCPLGPPERAGYEHQIVCLAEGLQANGIQCFSNINYWNRSAEEASYLIRHEPQIDPRDCDVIVFSSTIVGYHGLQYIPDSVFNPDRKHKLVFIDCADGIETPGFLPKMRNCDVVLKSHYNKRMTYPRNFRPWQFGLSQRMLEAVRPLPPAERHRSIAVNFRVNHSVREMAMARFLPAIDSLLRVDQTTDDLDFATASDLDRMYWEQTGRRHNPAYYSRLSGTLACGCFGGQLEKSIDHRMDLYGKVGRRLEKAFRCFPRDTLCWFDSWRFWEAFAAGCCVFHCDLERYAAALPVMPVNGEHYLGVDFSSMERLLHLCRNPGGLERISQCGREWAIKHYSPQAVASRFGSMVL